ncbi:hypothetical protein [Eilatimonas milleporae]|uniref:Uncharacterized protein n=1 Tax=Eilatimonas milleporae TaxID=911205 RepID=A0A3M0CI79_9PROT|nr:hypothetical protein [Eilatimonas milleporae]RMB08190.1 hypothetical protein BXY39_2286 [Eilatimonas milleporae]
MRANFATGGDSLDLRYAARDFNAPGDVTLGDVTLGDVTPADLADMTIRVWKTRPRYEGDGSGGSSSDDTAAY